MTSLEIVDRRKGSYASPGGSDTRATVQIIDGTATVEIDGAEAHLEPAEVAVFDRGHPWILRAESDCAVLLAIAWPPGKARI